MWNSIPKNMFPLYVLFKKNQYEWCREFQYSGEPKSHASADEVAGFPQHQGCHARALMLNDVQREHGATSTTTRTVFQQIITNGSPQLSSINLHFLR